MVSVPALQTNSCALRLSPVLAPQAAGRRSSESERRRSGRVGKPAGESAQCVGSGLKQRRAHRDRVFRTALERQLKPPRSGFFANSVDANVPRSLADEMVCPSRPSNSRSRAASTSSDDSGMTARGEVDAEIGAMKVRRRVVALFGDTSLMALTTSASEVPRSKLEVFVRYLAECALSALET